jgi:hypothetical protein
MTPEEVAIRIRAQQPQYSHPIRDRMIVEAVRSDDTDGFFLRAHRSALTKPVDTLSGMLAAYRTSKSINRAAQVGLDFSTGILTDGINKLPRSRTGPVGNILMSASKAALRAGIDEAKSQLVSSWQENDRRILASRVSSYYKLNGDFNALYDSGDTNAVARALGLDTIYDTTKLMSGEDTAARMEMIAPMIKRLADVITHKTLDQLKVDSYQDEEIEALQVDNVKIWVALKHHQQDTNAKMEGLKSAVNELQSGLESTTALAYKNADDIETLALIMCDSVSPQQRRQMVETGLVAVPQGKKQEVLEEIDRQIAAQKHIDQISHVVNEGQALVQVLGNLHVDPRITKPVSTVVNAGQAIFSAYLSFQTGNYFAAAASVTGLFGGGSGGGPDRQVMEFLQKISDQLKEMGEKLDQILKTQREILRKLDELERSLQVKFESLQSDILLNRQLIVEDQMNLLNLLEKLDNIGDGMVVVDFRSNRLPSYTELQEIHRRHDLSKGDLWNIFRIFEIGDRGGLSRLFLLETHIDADGPDPAENAKRITSSFASLVKVWDDLASNMKIEVDKILGLATNPTDRARHLNTKLAALRKPESQAGVLAQGYGRPLREIVGQLLHIGFLGRVTEVLLNTHFMQMTLPSDDPVTRRPEIPPLEVLLERQPTLEGMEWIKGAIKVVDLAIIQQSMLSGDILLPMMYELFDGTLAVPKEDDQSKDLKNSILKLLADHNHELLRKNVGVYFIRQRLAQNWNSIDTIYERYKQALEEESTSRERLHQWLKTTGPGLNRNGPYWHLVRRDEGQYWQISEELKLSIPLPPSERISDECVSQCYHTPAMGYLLELREYLIEHRDSYDFAKRFPQSQDGRELYLGVLCTPANAIVE